MRIVWVIHGYPPYHNSGAEWMAHSINKFLLKKGHEIKVLYRSATKGSFDGVEVDRFGPDANEETRGYDLIFTHLLGNGHGLNAGRYNKIPVVEFIHNDIEINERRVREGWGVNMVYNSEWVKEKLGYGNNGFVLPPPCDFRDYDDGLDHYDKEFISLINHNASKGGGVMVEVAKRLTNRKFLGVLGGYGDHVFKRSLKNITYVDHTPKIKGWYEQTRILIMPSKYESWGRTATEAMCSGIPVICSPTPGLKENCGDAGVYVDRDDIEGWIREIEKLDDRDYYKEVSERCKRRSRELDPLPMLEGFNKWIETL